MKKYDKYKHSGVEWIGEIPEHWEVKKVKYVTENFDAKRIPLSSDQRGVKQGEFPYYGANGIIDYIDEFIFDGNFVLVGEDGAPFFIRNRDVAFKATGKFWVNNHAHILKCKNGILEDILVHQLNLVDYKLYITGSTRDKLTQGELENIILIDIPRPEQTAIANYLDKKTAQIDSLIEKKKKLLELYKEERTAVVNHAVTRGIDPNVKLKPSGIDWLGDIPEHWEVKKLKYVANVQSSNVDKKTIEGENPIFLCNYIDVYKNEFIDDYFNFMEATATDKEIEKFILKKGDVLITKDSETPDDIANPAYVILDFDNIICGYHLAQIRTNKNELLGEFLFRLFQSKQFNSHFEVSANGVTRFGLPLDSITDVKILFPKTNEQIRIVQHIETETKRIDAKIANTEKLIELLQEYRTALISEVVTGKIKVV